ncbi:MAG: hypothetical protein Q7S51_03235, partial [Gallionellaceae bacterium]|nr:hypothetical protein [Gallionellaceae bacterium]
MKCHLLIADLFLPQQAAAASGADLSVPILEKLLARAQHQPWGITSLEDSLCAAFGIQHQAIAPITLLADGVSPGDKYWLRADPSHIQMQREQMILRPEIPITSEEAAQLCAMLNAHFADEGLHFIAPHPQRWYLHLDAVPHIMTHPGPQVAGRNIRAYLP